MVLKSIAMLIVILSNQGYWIGGRENKIEIQWSVETGAPAAVLEWRLSIDQVPLPGGNGSVTLPEGMKSSTVSLKLPEVRVRTAMRWTYRVVSPDGKTEYGSGEAMLAVFPNDLLDSLPRMTSTKRVIVWDHQGRLSAVMKQAGAEHTSIQSPDHAAMMWPDIVFVGPDTLTGAPGEQTAIEGWAKSGASVIVFRQSSVRCLLGYEVAARSVRSIRLASSIHTDARLEYRLSHPLLLDLSAEDWRAMEDMLGQETLALQLPEDEAALEVIHWPREMPGNKPVPIDALLVTRSVGRGRVVLCQLPLGPWDADPRSQVFLVNATGYLSTRPEPTPSPSRRLVQQPQTMFSLPSIIPLQ